MIYRREDGENDLFVFAPHLSVNILPDIIEKLASLGLDCEFDPEFDPLTFDGFLPFKVIVKNDAFKNADLYGKTPLWTAFEWEVKKYKFNGWVNEKNPPELIPLFRTILEKAQWKVGFGGINPDSLAIRLQFYVAASLTILTQGVLSYNNFLFTGENAVQLAIDEADYFDNENSNELFLFPFISWGDNDEEIDPIVIYKNLNKNSN